jgi:4-amino-4-deoxy-L-arabinose transferase-like glycosyltransferase
MPHRRWYPLGLSLLGGLFFLPFLGGVHLFDWDEINFAECAREMLLLDEYLKVYMDFRPFWEKPPLFFWLQALCMHLFGVGEYAARLPNAICGMLTLPIIYHIGRQVHDARMGLLWAGSYVGSVLPLLYFKSGIIDPWFNLFMFLGLYGFVLFVWKKQGQSSLRLPQSRWLYLCLGGLALGLAIMTKGPAAAIIIGLCLAVYWVWHRFRWYAHLGEYALFGLVALALPLSWFGLETLQNGPWFVVEFTKYQYRLFSTPDAGHGGFPGYHFVVLLIGCFPASIFTIRGFFTKSHQAHQLDFKRWMVILFWVVLILFSVVQSKIVHYSSMAYFPLTYLAALALHRAWVERQRLDARLRGGLIAVASLYGLAVVLLPLVAIFFKADLQALIADPFARASLDADVTWRGIEVLPAGWLLAVMIGSIYLLRRKEWEKGLPVLFGGTAVFVFLTLFFFINKIEGYSQRAAIDFFIERQDEACYPITAGYKSYAHLFYSRKQPPKELGDAPPVTPGGTNVDWSWDAFTAPPKPYRPRIPAEDRNWLLRGDIDQPVYLSTKIHQAEGFLATYPEVVELRRENGFVFLVRRP